MKKTKKVLALVVSSVLCLGALSGCSNSGQTVGNDTSQPAGSEKPEADTDSSGEIILSVNPNYEGAQTYMVKRGAGDLVLKMDIEDNVKTPARRGYVFGGWGYDAEGTKALGEEDTIEKDTTIYAVWEAWDEATAARMEMALAEAEQAKYICNYPTAYTKETFDAYQSLAAPIMFLTMGGGVLPAEMEGLVYALAGAREALQLAPGVADPEDTVWYIWGDHMAQAKEADGYDYYGTWDNEGFQPFLVPYMLENQSMVKGNIILISGGGFQQRANRWEGYPGAEVFNGLGYNCFVLQRRVEPFTPIDAGLDLQRVIRYLKFHADDYGIGNIENLAAAGYSGGGSTINIAVEQLYGDIQPTVVYPDYQGDEVDAVNADLSTMILVYSARPLETENPHIPDVFIVNGIEDEYTSIYEDSIAAINYYKENNVRYELHFFADAAHGFGNGFGLSAKDYTDQDVENVKIWPPMADTFMQIQYGAIQNIETLQQGPQ